jgi:hypothetical protein
MQTAIAIVGGLAIICLIAPALIDSQNDAVEELFRFAGAMFIIALFILALAK